LRSVEEPHKATSAKGEVNSGITTWNRIGDDECDLIERNKIDAKAPDEVLDIGYMLLVGLGGEKGLKHPRAAMELTNMAELVESGDGLFHDWGLSGAIVDFSNSDGTSSTSIDDALVILDWDEEAFFIKDGPIFLDEVRDSSLDGGRQMG
jgi:hypothetical protein